MAISVTCEMCGATYTVPDDRAGQVGKCRCGSSLRVPGTSPVARPASADPHTSPPSIPHPPPEISSAPAVAPAPEPAPERTVECRQCGMFSVPGNECEWCHASLAALLRPSGSTEAEQVPKPTGTTLNSVFAVLVLLIGLMLAGVAIQGSSLIFFGVGVLLMVSGVGLLRLHMAAWWTAVVVLTVSILSHVSGLLGGPAPFVILIIHPVGSLAIQVVILLYYLWARESFVQAGVGGVKLATVLLVCLPIIAGAILLVLAHRGQQADATSRLISAVKMGEVNQVQYLISKGANLETRDDQFGWTPLIWAASTGQANIVAALLKSGADPNAKGSKLGSTALGCAYGHPDIIQMLKEAGAK